MFNLLSGIALLNQVSERIISICRMSPDSESIFGSKLWIFKPIPILDFKSKNSKVLKKPGSGFGWKLPDKRSNYTKTWCINEFAEFELSNFAWKHVLWILSTIWT